MKKMLAYMVRNVLARRGYVLWKREFLRFGMSPFVDIQRLNRTWDRRLDVVFDVGANIGQFATEVLDELPNVRVYSFEPHPKTFQALKSAMSDDRLSLHEMALGEHIGDATLYVYGESGDGSRVNSLVPNARFPVKFGLSASEMTVYCTTIDAFCADNGLEHIGLLKADTEGFELSVLRGAKRMFQEGRIDFVYVEFNDLRPSPGTTGGALLPISDFLAQFGLRYVVTYTDFVMTKNEIAVCANALFALPCSGATANVPGPARSLHPESR